MAREIYAMIDAANYLKTYRHARNALVNIEMKQITVVYPETIEILKKYAEIEDNYTRSNWYEVLGKYTNFLDIISDISIIIDYSFTDQDLFTFCCLHKGDKRRQEIEALLIDCNYHKYCSMLSNQQYEQYIETVVHEYYDPEEKPLF